MLVVRVILLRTISVIGQLAPDGVIELVDLQVETTWPDHADLAQLYDGLGDGDRHYRLQDVDQTGADRRRR